MRTLEDLRTALYELLQDDSEQEVTGMAVPTIHAVIAEAKTFLPDDDPVLDQIADVLSPETVIAGSVRCADAYMVVNIIIPRLEEPPDWSPSVI